MVLVRRFAFAMMIIGFAGGGCTTVPWIQELRLAPTGLAPKDSIAIILRSPVEDERLSELENKVTGCIRDAFGDTYPDLRFVPAEELRKLVFPQLSTETIPTGELLWQGLQRDPAFHGRIAPLGLRYLIAVNAEESTRLTGFEGGPGSSMLGGPLAHWSWERSAIIEAIVVDTKHHRVSGHVLAYASGKSEAGIRLVTVPFPVPVPYGMTSFPASVACQALGERLVKFLTGEIPAEGQAAK